MLSPLPPVCVPLTGVACGAVCIQCAGMLDTAVGDGVFVLRAGLTMMWNGP